MNYNGHEIEENNCSWCEWNKQGKNCMYCHYPHRPKTGRGSYTYPGCVYDECDIDKWELKKRIRKELNLTYE